jgi:FkbM family methyltransferase
MVLFIPNLKEYGHLGQVHMTICNVGSRKLSANDNYASGGWSYFIPHLSIYGFDADSDACDAANAELEAQAISWTERHIPLGISNSIGETTLYVTKHPMCSSLYPPNEKFLDRLAGLPEAMALDFTLEIETTTLDEASKNEGFQEIDFLQIDVQGADLNVLKGASQLLEKSILAIQIEVEFNPLYIDQPLFSDVDLFMRQQGFTLFDLSRTHFPRTGSPVYLDERPGQILWGDAIYFRDLIRDDLASQLKKPEQIFKLACIADVLQFPDYALELLKYLTFNYGSETQFNYAKVVIDTLANLPGIIEEGQDKFPVFEQLKPFL